MSSFFSINKEQKFYDKKDLYDSKFYSQIPKSSNEFGTEYMKIAPKEGEIRLLANRHKDCMYYAIGLDLCRSRVLSDNRKSFLACKPVLDSMFRCYTNDSEALEYHKIRNAGKKYMLKFSDCLFKTDSYFENCMEHFEDSIRAIYRDQNHNLIDYY